MIQSGSRVRTLLLTCSAALVVFVCLGGFFVLGGVGLSTIFGEPELEIRVNAPLTAQVGETFAITLDITNTGVDTLTVTEIQIPKILLEGSDITGSLPVAAATHDYSGQIGYLIALEISPTQTRTVTFIFNAVRPGDFGGDIGVLVGRRTRSAPVRMQVLP